MIQGRCGNRHICDILKTGSPLHHLGLNFLFFFFSALAFAFTTCEGLTGIGTIYTVTVTQPANGGTVGVSPESGPAGTTIYLSNSPASGYAFSHYTVGGERNNIGSFTLNKDVTVSGVFTADETPVYTVTVTQPANGGTVGADPESGPAGTTITLSNSPVAGYAFSHYTIDGERNDSGSFTLNTDVTVSGVFMVTATPTYTVTFESDGGTPAPSIQTVPKGGAVTEPSPMTKAGFTFGGWHADSAFSGEPWNFESGAVSADVTLYAKWIDITVYAVSFDADGGSPATETRMVNDGGTVGSDMPSDPAKSGYVFDGWYTAQNGGDSEFTGSTMVIANITVYAKWTVITYIDSVPAFLENASGGVTVDDPVYLPVAIDLGNMTDSGGGWQQLLNVIATANKFIAMDMSNCALDDAVFNPVYTISAGKNRIVSLILPDAAAAITHENYGYPLFKDFTVLKSVIGEGVLTIGDYTFYDCDVLTTVNFPEATSIEDYAFYNCGALTNVNFPKATTIGISAFQSCTAITNVNLPQAISIGQGAFASSMAIKSVNIPMARSIGNGAFYSACKGMTNIELPSATTIGDGAFRGCSNLVNVTLPATATLGEGVFAYTSVSSFNLIGSGSLTTIEGGKALVRNGAELLDYPTASGDIELSGITIIGRDVFASCQMLTSVNFPDAISIGSNAFNGCWKLVNVNLPVANGIGNDAFGFCWELAYINIPLVASIGDNAFEQSTTDITIVLGATAPTAGRSVFWIYSDESRTVTVKVPSGATSYGSVPSTFSGIAEGYSWGNAFRGGGTSSYDSRYVSANVTLTIEYQ